MNKYEQLIEHIINDEDAKARELFHDIVVEKSRDIYENLIDESDLAETEMETEEEKMQEIADQVETEDEGLAEDDEDEAEAEEVGDEEGEEMDMAMSMDADEAPADEDEVEERVEDLEDALDELKAEFDALMAGEDTEVEADAEYDQQVGDEQASAELADEMPMNMAEAKDEDEDKEEVDEACDEDEDKEDAKVVKEYVEKVPAPSNQEGADNTKSTVAGKNDMGGTAVDMDLGSPEANPDGTKPAKAPKPKADLMNNELNKPGADAGKKTFKKKEKAKLKPESAGVNDDSVIDG